MSDALQLKLESYEVTSGREVTGSVRVLQDMPACRQLTVLLQRVGKDILREEEERKVLATGPLSSGSSIPFPLPVPEQATPSFQGHHHNLEWSVRAEADLPWAINPKAEQPLAVRAPVLPAGASMPPAPPEAAGGMSMGVKILLFALIGPFLVLALLMLVVFLPPVALYLVAKWHVKRSRVKGLKLVVPGRPAMLGEAVPVVVEFELGRAIHLDGMSLCFQGTEHWVTGSGKQRSDHFHHFHEERIQLLPAGVLAPVPDGSESRVRLRAMVSVPRDGLPSHENSVYYKLETTIQVKGWPDPTQEERLPVNGVLRDAPARPAAAGSVEPALSGVRFVADGDELPEGLDVRSASENIWPWIILPSVGAYLLLIQFPMHGLNIGVPHLTSWGIGLCCLGLLAFFWKIRR